jgi:hypothetical protein
MVEFVGRPKAKALGYQPHTNPKEQRVIVITSGSRFGYGVTLTWKDWVTVMAVEPIDVPVIWRV